MAHSVAIFGGETAPAAGGGAPFSILQGPTQSSDFGASTPSVALAYPGATASGSMLICVFATDNVDGASCSDSVNGSWGSPVVSAVSNSEADTGKGACYIWAVDNPTGGGTPTVTVTQTGTTNNYGRFEIYEVSGLATKATQPDATGTVVENVNVNSSCDLPITTNTAGCFIAGILGFYGNDTSVADSGFTLAQNSVVIGYCYQTSEYTASSPGAAATHHIICAQTTTKQYWRGAAAAFKLA